MKDTETRHRFVSLRAKGLSYDKIAKELEVTKPTLLKWAAELSEEISGAKLLELDGLLEQFELAKVSRVKSLATLLKKVEAELDKRDFTNVKTEKLFELAQSLRAEIVSEVGGVGRQFEFGGIPDDIFQSHRVTVTALD